MTGPLVVILLTVLLAGSGLIELRLRNRRARPDRILLDADRVAATASAVVAAQRSHPVLDDLMHQLREELGFSYAFANLVLDGHVNAVGASGLGDGMRTGTVRDSLCATVVGQNRPVVIEGTAMVEAAVGGCLGAVALAFYAAIPLRVNGQVVGALGVADRRGRHRSHRTTDDVVTLLEPHARRIERLLQPA